MECRMMKRARELKKMITEGEQIENVHEWKNHESGNQHTRLEMRFSILLTRNKGKEAPIGRDRIFLFEAAENVIRRCIFSRISLISRYY